MIQLKNILAENMRRFGTKNLHEAPTFETRELQLADILISLTDSIGAQLIVDPELGLDGLKPEKKLISGTFDANESLNLRIRVDGDVQQTKGQLKIYGNTNGGDFSMPTINLKNALGVTKRITLEKDAYGRYTGVLFANHFCSTARQPVPQRPINLDCGTVTLSISYSNINTKQGGQEGEFEIRLNAEGCDIRPELNQETP